MNLNKILIASVLKNVDDVRHYGKIAKSLEKANKYQIFILGKGSEKKSSFANISFLCTGQFNRISFKRLIIQAIFVSYILRFKPQIVLVTTIELLPIASILKILLGFKLVYDVQEDYLSNIKHQVEYNSIQKIIFIPIVLIIQFLFHRQVDHFLLAEAIYETSIGGLKNRFTVLENKVFVEEILLANKKWKNGQPLNVLFSGSLSEYSGVKNALNIFNKIKKDYINSRLVIIGSYYNKELEDYLKRHTEADSSIKLFIEDKTIDHSRIVEQIKKSNLGIIGYKPNPTNSNRTPTKLYEYARFGLPYVIADNPHWSSVSDKLGGGITIDFNHFDVNDILKRLHHLEKWDLNKSCWIEEIKMTQDVFINL